NEGRSNQVKRPNASRGAKSEPGEGHSGRPGHRGDWRWADDPSGSGEGRQFGGSKRDGGKAGEPAYLRRCRGEDEPVVAGRQGKRPGGIAIHVVRRRAGTATAELYHRGAAGAGESALRRILRGLAEAGRDGGHGNFPGDDVGGVGK